MENNDPAAIRRLLAINRKHFLKYNSFRRKVFAELSPREGEALLYLLPWLLSINHPACPGYIRELKHPFRVHGIEQEKGIKKREPEFKARFGVGDRGSLIKPTHRRYYLQGLYTIGSVGTASQNSKSDCDIWICFDKENFSKTAWRHLNYKVNLIKDWLDEALKMPVFFFVSDTESIRRGRFGAVDSESSGSTQQNILKEEFYRTSIVIAGKVPLWWLCWNGSERVDYPFASQAVQTDTYGADEIVDLGDITHIKRHEYFGAALWQFQKALDSPLKSIIKMVLLQMQLSSPPDELICHRLRAAVYACDGRSALPDPSLFTVTAILEAYRNRRKGLTGFVLECFYLRCEPARPAPRASMKARYLKRFLKNHPIKRSRIKLLARHNRWEFLQQVDFGKRLFRYLHQIYREMSAAYSEFASESDRRDLTILGRRISAYHLKKKHKVDLFPKPSAVFALDTLTLIYRVKTWHLFADRDRTTPICSSMDIVQVMCRVVWNDLFNADRIRMMPNSSSITHREIVSLGRKIREFFGTRATCEADYDLYLKHEMVTRIMMVADFSRSPWESGEQRYSAIYMNSWGEMFCRRFGDAEGLQTFIAGCRRDNPGIDIGRYMRRRVTSFEKDIARPKAVSFPTVKP